MDKYVKKENTDIDRRDFVASAAGLATVFTGIGSAYAGGHNQRKINFSEADKAPRPVREGSQILITGANRGLGYEFTRQYAELGAKIIATARKPNKADALNLLAENNSNIKVEKLDVTDHENIIALAKKYVDIPIDILLNNAGIGGGVENQLFGKMDYETFDQVMAVNVKGPIKMCEEFRKNVEASELKKMITVSSSQGSISSVTSPMLYWYRASKSALNMIMANLAYQVQRKKIIVGLVTPGATATDFIPPSFRKAIRNIQTPEEATADMMRNIERFTLETSGTFYDYDGGIVPW
ncbi:MAG: SDR family oxidoreductase [Pseudomonadota bacterium]|nr:SDR family oxidoreductase [Pseudomonadota bacterium]